MSDPESGQAQAPSSSQLHGNDSQLSGNNSQLQGNNGQLQGNDSQLQGNDSQLQGRPHGGSQPSSHSGSTPVSPTLKVIELHTQSTSRGKATLAYTQPDSESKGAASASQVEVEMDGDGDDGIGASAEVPQAQRVSEGQLGTLTGVLIPTCENMWGVLIFLRFFYVVGQAGVAETLTVVFLSYACALFTTFSLAAIATNGPIQRGGAYFLISRVVGPAIGGAVGCVYFLGITLLAVLETLGAVEMLLYISPAVGDFVGATRIWATGIVLAMAGMVWAGINFVSKLGAVFAVVVFLTLLSYFIGLGVAPQRDGLSPMITGISWETMKGNWGPDYDPEVNFSKAVSVFFPCFTGILSGANRANSLRDPARSIPVGTFGAINLSLVMYLAFFLLWGAVAEREYLKNGAAAVVPEAVTGSVRKLLAGGGGSSLSIVGDIAFPVALAAEIGIVIASISQALQCLIVAPRLLQAIAADGAIPILSFAAPLSKSGEPVRALLFTSALAIAACMIGALDAVAPLLSVCFLSCYATLNLSGFVMAVMKAPSWKPTFRWFHYWLGLIGFLHCTVMMFLIQWWAALIAVCLCLCLYIYIDWKQVQVDWGTGLGGLKLQMAAKALISLKQESSYFVNWRPQLLVLHKIRNADPSSSRLSHSREEMIEFAQQLKKGKGLCVVAGIIEGHLFEKAEEAKTLSKELEDAMEDAGLKGFAHAVVAPSFREGKSAALQLAGLGGLSPNTLVEGWPHHWRESGHEEDAAVFVETITECTAMQKAMLVAYGLRSFPSTKIKQGIIHVWWIMHDGGLLILMAHLLTKHKIWANCKLKLHAVAGKLDNSEMMRVNLEALLERARIEADVEVVEYRDDDLLPYTHDWTMRVNEARRFRNELQTQMGRGSVIEGTMLSRARSTAGNEGSALKNMFLQAPDQVAEVGSCSSQEAPSEHDPSRRGAGTAPKAHGNPAIPTELDLISGAGHDWQRPKNKKWSKTSPDHLNSMILSRSKDSQLVIINLPDPIKTVQPKEYMDYCETLVQGMRRVLFVHGTGKEIWTH